MRRTAISTGLISACLMIAGHGWAGEELTPGINVGDAATGNTWIGEYRQTQAGQGCDFTFVRSERRAEYRGCGQPTRIWRRLNDGVELTELHLVRGEAVRYSPGDLRVTGREPDWAQVASPVRSTSPQALGNPVGAFKFGDQPALRYRGTLPDGRKVQLDWLESAQLPTLYRVGEGRQQATIELRKLLRADESLAFTNVADLREVDGADLGD